MRAGSIVFVEIPVRDLTRAANFYASLFGWSFEHDETDRWFFTTGGSGPMGRITVGRPIGGDGIRVTVAVDDIAAVARRAIALGGGTTDADNTGRSDIGEWTVLVDPDGNRFGIFHGTTGDRRDPERRSDARDGEPDDAQ